MSEGIEKELFSTAVDVILEDEESNDRICEELHRIPGEFDYCSNNCQNMTKECIIRYLKLRRIKGN